MSSIQQTPSAHVRGERLDAELRQHFDRGFSRSIVARNHPELHLAWLVSAVGTRVDADGVLAVIDLASEPVQ